MSDPNSPDPTLPSLTGALAGQQRSGVMMFLGFGRTKITSIQKVLRLTFKTDHHSMTDNNSDWQNTGSVFPKPEWTYGKASSPISHTKNQKVLVEVDFEVNPTNADETDADVTGTAAFGSLVFTATKQKFKGGVITVTAESTAPLPDLVEKLTGDIKWSVNTTKDGVFDAGASWGHTIYVTMDTPISVAGREAGITQYRMEKSVALVQGTGKATAPWTAAPSAIVLSLMGLIPDYRLVADPAVNNARPGVSHPDYFNSMGGAWNIADFISAAAECQAIVRFFRAVIKQVGCPGTALIMLIYADPTVNNGNTVLEDDMEGPPPNDGLHHVPNQTVNGHNSFASLLGSARDGSNNPVAGAVKQGAVFDGNKRNLSLPKILGIGSNAYEACMKFTDPAGTTAYYPGGVASAGLPTKEQVILVFQALAWMSSAPGGKPTEDLLKVEKIVKSYP